MLCCLISERILHQKKTNKNSTFLGFAYLYVCICVWENISNYNVFIYQQITTRIFLWIKIQVKTLLTSIINTLYIYMYIEAVDRLIDWLISVNTDFSNISALCGRGNL